jgi:single-stranded-DNA-specific exonuclease
MAQVSDLNPVKEKSSLLPIKQPKKWWIYPQIDELTNERLKAFAPFMRQLLYNRECYDEVTATEYLNASQPLGDPFDLLDMEKTVRRLLAAIDTREPVVIYGDYDVDGVSATALMVQVLKAMGANARAYIPNRFDEGYGLNVDALHELAGQGVKLILTVDCGIRSQREATEAAALGIDLIISDHHYPKGDLPLAFAVICPKREGDPYPFKEMAGVGLAYKIAQGLFTRRNLAGYSADGWLDLVALGTVADVVPLIGENRVLVRKGIALLRQGKRIGLQALIRVSGKEPARITAGDIGYILGPRLNAAGRIDSAMQAYDLLMSESVDDSALLAQRLDNQNSSRQRITKEARKKAEDEIGPEPQMDLISSFAEDYSSGIVGLVATGLVDTYYRPAVVGSKEAEFTRASCRSISEFHITRALDECADLLERHGGHAMAAGFTVRNENIALLLERLNQIASREFAGKELRKTIRADLEIPISSVRNILLRELEKLQPTGMGNPDAVFVSRNVEITRPRAIGAEKIHLKFSCQAGDYLVDAVAWRQADWLRMLPGRFDLIYSIEENDYMGNRTMQINVKDMYPSGGGAEA